MSGRAARWVRWPAAYDLKWGTVCSWEIHRRTFRPRRFSRSVHRAYRHATLRRKG